MRTLNEDEFDENEERALLELYYLEQLFEPLSAEELDGDEIEEYGPDLYDQYEYMLEHQDDE